MSLFGKLKESLFQRSSPLLARLDQVLTGRVTLDEAAWESLLEGLVGSDMGLPLAESLLEVAQRKAAEQPVREAGDIKMILMQEIAARLAGYAEPLREEPLSVNLLVGVNGSGKTTTAAKLAYRYRREGRRPLLVAADTYRAAAIEQLQAWGERLSVDVYKQKPGQDPASVAYDGISLAQSRGYDAVIVDTAGRLQTKSPLMNELQKMRRVIARLLPAGPTNTLLVLDATTGQNALSQGRLFHEAVEITHLVLTKLDGTARGGIVLNLTHTLRLPVALVGVGEQAEDLLPFAPREFAAALVGAQAPPVENAKQ